MTKQEIAEVLSDVYVALETGVREGDLRSGLRTIRTLTEEFGVEKKFQDLLDALPKTGTYLVQVNEEFNMEVRAGDEELARQRVREAFMDPNRARPVHRITYTVKEIQ